MSVPPSEAVDDGFLCHFSRWIRCFPILHPGPDVLGLIAAGLPLGYQTSQLLALLFLDEFDHFIQEELGYRYYGRYMARMSWALSRRSFCTTAPVSVR